jgi:thymidylate synthase (FAD)
MTKRQVLDHGYVKLITHWGSDEDIIEAARMSTGKGFQGWGPVDTGPCDTCRAKPGKCWNCSYGRQEHTCHTCKGTGRTTKPGDEKLLKFLWQNKHASPFEFAGLTVEVQAPLIVLREWQRHRTQSFSEMSARYAPLPDDNYVPTAERCLLKQEGNKQAGALAGSEQITPLTAEKWLQQLATCFAEVERVYAEGLRIGVPKEVARLAVPVARYSRMRATANLRNWLAFLTLRSDHGAEGRHAQYEIRQFANVVADLVQEKFPRTYGVWSSKEPKA